MINLSKGGQTVSLSKENMKGTIGVKMKWKTGVDLDLHCKVKSPEGTHHVYYGSKGGLNSFPYTKLDKDAGVGSTAGDNEENMQISDLSKLDDVLLYVENYGRSYEDFSKYKAQLTLKFNNETINVDMNSKVKGKYFVIAKISNGKLTNINEVIGVQPSLSMEFEGNETDSDAPVRQEKKGILSKLKSLIFN